ncbi:MULTISPECIES: hypothetical protein [Bradyrhizobium]|uniref:phosphorylase family protein n=1 Tax=Bradyrhizobium TaxID=374 RepID=UPI003619E69F
MSFAPFWTTRAEGKNQYYEHARPRDGDEIGVAITKSPEQGQIAAQATANNMIMELAPRWILLVGIAGGIPDAEYSLGDVVLSSRVYDFSVTAAFEGGASAYQQQGGPPHMRSTSSWPISRRWKRISATGIWWSLWEWRGRLRRYPVHRASVTMAMRSGKRRFTNPLRPILRVRQPIAAPLPRCSYHRKQHARERHCTCPAMGAIGAPCERG